MTVVNPLSILACMTRQDQSVSISLQKLNRKGHASQSVSTHVIDIGQDHTPQANPDQAFALMRCLHKNRIHHHGQPEISQIINAFLNASGMIELDNDVQCSRTLVDQSSNPPNPSDISSLARREGIAESLITQGQHSSAALCDLYFRVFSNYIRHIREDVFEQSDASITDWKDNLSAQEKSLISLSRPVPELPDGWEMDEAEAIALMHLAGDHPSTLATLSTRPLEEIQQVISAFEPD